MNSILLNGYTGDTFIISQFVCFLFSERRGRRSAVHHKGEPPSHGRLPVHRLQRRAALDQQASSAQSSM